MRSSLRANRPASKTVIPTEQPPGRRSDETTLDRLDIGMHDPPPKPQCGPTCRRLSLGAALSRADIHAAERKTDNRRHNRRHNMLPSALFALPLLAAPAAADLADRAITVGIACFGYAGASYPNNTLCPNSKGCCGYQATCLSNKLCHNPSDGAGTFVRGPCSVNGWDDDCAQICKYNETLNQGFLPRVTVCDDGSLCCNNEPTCCNDGKGIFLDGTGKVVSKLSTDVITSYPPIQTTSGTATDRITATPTSSASTTSRTTTTSQTTTAAAATSSAAASTDDDDSSNRIGLRVGLGVGIPAAAVVAVASVFLLLRRKHARQRRLDLIDSGLQQPMKPVPSVSGSYPTHYTSELAVTSPGTSYQASELPVEHVQRFELDAQPYQDRR